MAIITKTLEVKLNKCERCGYEWQQRRKRRPKVCPECKSREWNKPRPTAASSPQELATA